MPHTAVTCTTIALILLSYVLVHLSYCCYMYQCSSLTAVACATAALTRCAQVQLFCKSEGAVEQLIGLLSHSQALFGDSCHLLMAQLAAQAAADASCHEQLTAPTSQSLASCCWDHLDRATSDGLADRLLLQVVELRCCLMCSHLGRCTHRTGCYTERTERRIHCTGHTG